MTQVDCPPVTMPAEPKRSVVLLGASNLTRGAATAIRTCQVMWRQPLDVMVAAGFGRSYGMTSRILGRALPSIVSCGIWKRFQECSAMPSTAFITDIGNDLLYGVSVDELVCWVEICVTRLVERCETVVLARLPMESVRGVGAVKYACFRRLLFPGSSLTLEQIQTRAEQLDQRLVKLAADYDVETVEPRLSWYGMDPIHIRRCYLALAWPEMLLGLTKSTEMSPVYTSWLERCRFRCVRPLHRQMFGRQQDRLQPSMHLPDGSTVSFY